MTVIPIQNKWMRRKRPLPRRRKVHGHNAGGNENGLSDEISGGEAAGTETVRDVVMERSPETDRSATPGAECAQRGIRQSFADSRHGLHRSPIRKNTHPLKVAHNIYPLPTIIKCPSAKKTRSKDFHDLSFHIEKRSPPTPCIPATGQFFRYFWQYVFYFSR